TLVRIRLLELHRSSRVAGATELALSAVAVILDGGEIPIQTAVVRSSSKSRTSTTVKSASGGALIGALAGLLIQPNNRGTGAAVGAATGASIAVGAEAARGAADVEIPSEAVFSFVLTKPMVLAANDGSPSFCGEGQPLGSMAAIHRSPDFILSYPGSW